MATLRKRGSKWQAQVRSLSSPYLSRSFHTLKDAQAWARQVEAQADRGDLLSNPKTLEKLSLGDLVCRYRDTGSPRKKTAAAERIVLNAFLRHPICLRRLSELCTAHFAAYRDERLDALSYGVHIAEQHANFYHARVNAEIGVKADLTFLEQETRDEELPNDEEYPDLLDIIDNRLSEPEYSGYTLRLKQFLDSQTDEWHQRFRVYKIA